MVSYVAVPYQIYKLTHSTFLVGLLGFVQLVPIGVFGLLGGTIADRFDRRKLLLLSEIVMSFTAFCLMANSFLPSPNVFAIFVLVFIMQSANAYHRPAMEAMSQKIVQPGEYAAIGALGSLRYSFGAIAGPALGGILLSKYGVGVAYAFDLRFLGTAIFFL
jgi:MFS family permease